MRNSPSSIRGSAPETPRFIAVAPESLCYFGAAFTAPAIPASESTLGSHLCVALSSAQMFSEWTTSTQPCNDFSLNGNYLLSCCLTPGVHFSPSSRPLQPYTSRHRTALLGEGQYRTCTPTSKLLDGLPICTCLTSRSKVALNLTWILRQFRVSNVSPPRLGNSLLKENNRMESTAAGVAPARDPQTEKPQQQAAEIANAVNEHERLANLAYALWQFRGCPIGSPEQDWIEAKRQLSTAVQLERQLFGR